MPPASLLAPTQQPIHPFDTIIEAAIMSDEALTSEQVAEMRKKRTFRKFTFRGIDLDKLLDLSMEVCCPCCLPRHPPAVQLYYVSRPNFCLNLSVAYTCSGAFSYQLGCRY